MYIHDRIRLVENHDGKTETSHTKGKIMKTGIGIENGTALVNRTRLRSQPTGGFFPH